MSDQFEPKIVGFLCKWCTSAGADLAGTSRLKYPPNVIPVTMFCSSHYQTGNYKTLKRIEALRALMKQLGVEEARLRLEWISAAEGAKFARVVRDYTEEIRKLGPLELRRVAIEDET